MRYLTPYAPDSGTAILDFTPVPRRKRLGGWTAARQRAFIDALADTGSVTDAAKRVNMTPEGAYYLRRAPGAESFRAAWEAAAEMGMQSLHDLAVDRVRQGNIVTRYENGEIVSEKRWYDNRLLMFMLRRDRPELYGANARLSRGGRANFTPRVASDAEVTAALVKRLAAFGKRVSEERACAQGDDEA